MRPVETNMSFEVESIGGLRGRTLWYAFLISALLAPREIWRTSIRVSHSTAHRLGVFVRAYRRGPPLLFRSCLRAKLLHEWFFRSVVEERLVGRLGGKEIVCAV